MALTCSKPALIISTLATSVAFISCCHASSQYNLLGEDLFLNADRSFLSFREREFKGKWRLEFIASGISLFSTYHITIRRAICSFDAQFLSTPFFFISGESFQISTRAFASWFHIYLAQISIFAHITHLTPHSMHKGAATEMFAFGIPPERIRWSAGWLPASSSVWT